MNEQFQMIAKTFQGLEEVLAQELNCIRGKRHRNRPAHGVFQWRQGNDVQGKHSACAQQSVS